MTKHPHFKTLAGLAVLALICAATVRAETDMARVFGDNMVLQREKPVPVWGWDAPGQRVTVEFAGQKKIATADKTGKWMVRLDPMKASAAGRTMTVSGGSDVALKNILVGDVWLCSGQSNMGRSVERSWRPADMSLDHPTIRFFGRGGNEKYPQDRLPEADKPENRHWKICTGETTVNCCAVGFFFARRVQQEVDVPIGLLWQAWAGSVIREWMPRHAFRLQGELAEMADGVDAFYPNTPHGRKVWKERLAEIDTWLDQAEAAIQQREPLPRPQPLMPEPRDRDACCFYNGKIHPLVPFAVKGVLWYQGESDQRNAQWAVMLQAMAASWRDLFSEGDGRDIPFYWMQIQRSGDYCSPLVREQQRKALKLVPNSGMAVLLDLDVEVHPANKYDSGERLALWALAKDYGKKVPFSGPLYKSHRVDGSKIIVQFDHAGDGLMLGKKNQLAPVQAMPGAELTNVKIAGEDQKWHVAKTKIDGKTLVVWSDAAPKPVAVRYCYENIPSEPFLYNKAGLPAAQFRTDDWRR